MTDVTARSRLIDQIPSQDGRLVLVHTPIDSVDAVGHDFLVVKVQLNNLGVDVELLRVLKASSSNKLHSRIKQVGSGFALQSPVGHYGIALRLHLLVLQMSPCVSDVQQCAFKERFVFVK